MNHGTVEESIVSETPNNKDEASNNGIDVADVDTVSVKKRRERPKQHGGTN